MINEICVIGFPSKCGGADTELDHQIRVWQAMGLKVHIVHTGQLDRNLLEMRMEERGCVVHRPEDWSVCKGKWVISYCNGEFLAHLEAIRAQAKGAIWVNCMTWNFDAEVLAHQKGLIDLHLFQTKHGYERVSPKLYAVNSKLKYAIYRPYFHAPEYPYSPHPPGSSFQFGRISRADPAKFHQASLWVYDTMVSPRSKHGTILGFSERIAEKIGNPPNWITTFPEGGLPAQAFYHSVQAVIQMADTFENLPRVGFEAMSSGVLLIVDRRGGWCDLIRDGDTGFLCDDQREFVYRASCAAYDPGKVSVMTQNARDWLGTNWGLDAAKAEWERVFSGLE